MFTSPVQTPQLLTSTRKFEFNLEALRGFAALFVVLMHCFGFSKVLNGVSRQGLWVYDFPGQLSVIVFFILSGYVIGLSTRHPLTWQTTGTYLKKRFLRLYPIYACCLLLGLLITDRHYSIGTIIANFAFLQVTLTDAMYEVGVSWSLNYEMLFYLLFIPISIYRIRAGVALSLCLASALFFQFVVGWEQAALYSYGFSFWLVGLWLSQENHSTTRLYSRFTLTGLLCLMLAFPSLNFAAEILRYTLHLDNFNGVLLKKQVGIALSSFSYLPLGLLLVTSFTNRKLPFRWTLVAFSVVVPMLYLLLQLKHSRIELIEWTPKVVAYGFYIIGLMLMTVGILRKTVTSNLLPQKVIMLGSISYGMYMSHFLIIILLGRFPFLYGTEWSLGVRTALTVCITIGFSYFLEKVWHPLAVRQLKRLPVFRESAKILLA